MIIAVLDRSLSLHPPIYCGYTPLTGYIVVKAGTYSSTYNPEGSTRHPCAWSGVSIVPRNSPVSKRNTYIFPIEEVIRT
jgi:hypothetical protein